MILFFSGTGNSRYIAKRIAEALDEETIDLNSRIKSGNTEPVDAGERVIIVTPTYAWRIPKIVYEWLQKTELIGAGKVWFVMDCGGEIGNAAKYNKQLSANKHLKYMGTAQIVMPENYIAMFNAPNKKKAQEIVAKAEPMIDSVIETIQRGQHFKKTRDNFYDRVMSGPVNPVFYKFFVKADAFRADSTCIGCGKCAKLCPMNNIHMKKEKPVWGKNCTHCMACICYCPTKAIEYGKKSVGKPRYHFEALKTAKKI